MQLNTTYLNALLLSLALFLVPGCGTDKDSSGDTTTTSDATPSPEELALQERTAKAQEQASALAQQQLAQDAAQHQELLERDRVAAANAKSLTESNGRLDAANAKLSAERAAEDTRKAGQTALKDYVREAKNRLGYLRVGDMRASIDADTQALLAKEATCTYADSSLYVSQRAIYTCYVSISKPSWVVLTGADKADDFTLEYNYTVSYPDGQIRSISYRGTTWTN